jgi:hypothetical protein
MLSRAIPPRQTQLRISIRHGADCAGLGRPPCTVEELLTLDSTLEAMICPQRRPYFLKRMRTLDQLLLLQEIVNVSRKLAVIEPR